MVVESLVPRNDFDGTALNPSICSPGTISPVSIISLFNQINPRSGTITCFSLIVFSLSRNYCYCFPLIIKYFNVIILIEDSIRCDEVFAYSLRIPTVSNVNKLVAGLFLYERILSSLICAHNIDKFISVRGLWDT